jgi:hypothetical protein
VNSANEPACLQRGVNGKCIRYADIRSPVSFLKETIAAQAQQELAWVTNVDEIGELIIQQIAARLTNRLLDLGADEERPTYTSNYAGGVTTPAPGVPPGGPPPPPGGGGTCGISDTTNCVGICQNTPSLYGQIEGALCQAFLSTSYDTGSCGGSFNPQPTNNTERQAILSAICAAYSGPGNCSPVGGGAVDEVRISGLNDPACGVTGPPTTCTEAFFDIIGDSGQGQPFYNGGAVAACNGQQQ